MSMHGVGSTSNVRWHLVRFTQTAVHRPLVSPSLPNKRPIPPLCCTDLIQSGEGDMEITALFLFIGGVLGFRFKFLILIPASILAVIVTGSVEIAQRQDAWFSALSTLAAVIALQIGYVSSIPARVAANHAVTTTQKALDRLQLGFKRF